MNYKYIIWAATLLGIVLFQSCEEQITPPERPFNEELVFQNSEELIISTTLDSNDFPIFDISSVAQQKIFIAVSTEALTTANFEIENTDAIIWQWHSGLDAINQIKFENGELLNPNLAFNNGLCCNGDTYYWSAWSWDETGQYIEASTTIESFKVTTPTPTIELSDVILISESGGDGYAQKEEDITLRIYVKNTSNYLATNVTGSFLHPNVLTLPQTLQFGNLTAGASKYVDLSLKMPNISDENLEIDALFTYNDNLTLDTLVIQHIALLPCIEEYYLDWIANSLNNMDPNALFTANQPADLFFEMFVTNFSVIDSFWFWSGTNENVKNQDLPVGWFTNLNCREFDVISTFTMVFYDEDITPIPDKELINSIDFSFTEFVETQNYPEIITFKNDFVHIRLKVKWQ